MCGSARNNTTDLIQAKEQSLQVPDIFLMFVALLGIFLNGVLLLFGRKNLPKSCSIFICNLAVADLATAVVALVLGFRRLIISKMFRRIIAIMSWCTVLASFFTLVGIAVQRYIAVVHSIWSHSKMKNHQWCYKVIISGIWLVAFTFGILLHYYSDVTRLVITCLSEIMIFVIIVLYLRIYLSFRSYRVKDKEGIFAANKHRLSFNLKREAKLSMVVCCVTAMLVIGVLPNVIILQTMEIIILSGDVDKAKCMEILHDFNSYWAVMEVLGFSLNPLIYFWHLQMTKRISDSSIESFQSETGFSRSRRRIVPEITMKSQPTEMTISVCLADNETTQKNTVMTSSC